MCLIAEAKDKNLLTIITFVEELLIAYYKNTLQPQKYRSSPEWAGPVLLLSPEAGVRGESH